MSATKTLLLIDDDNDLRGALKEQFELYDTFRIIEAATASEGMTLAKADRIDLILLDVDLPDMDGRDACKILRRDGVRAPIVMLTGQTTDADTILGLENIRNK